MSATSAGPATSAGSATSTCSTTSTWRIRSFLAGPSRLVNVSLALARPFPGLNPGSLFGAFLGSILLGPLVCIAGFRFVGRCGNRQQAQGCQGQETGGEETHV